MKISMQQWEDSFRNRFYPLDIANPPESSRGETLPVGFLRDIVVFMSSTSSRAVLSAIEVSGDTEPLISIYITDAEGNPAGRADLPTLPEGRYPLTSDGLPAGYVDIGAEPAAVVRGWFPGRYVFATPILPHLVVIADPAWRRGFSLPDGTVLPEDTYIIGDRGIRLEIDGGDIVIHADGDAFAGRDAPRRPLQTLRGVEPSPQGDIRIVPLPSTPGEPFRVNAVPLSGGRIRLELLG